MKRIIESELAALARFLISRFRPYIIGVTGSSGKTTTKYFIGELIKATEETVKIAPGNLNTKTGLPLSVLGFHKSPKNYFQWLWIALYSPIKALFTFKFEKFLILEYAADLPGDMDKLVRIAAPQIVAVTSIGSAHIEIFETEEAIAKEKWQLAAAAKVAVVTNRQVAQKVAKLKEPSAAFYILPSMKFAKAENVKLQTNKMTFDFYLSNDKKEVEFKYFGKHNIENLEIAAFVSYLATKKTKPILNAIKDLQPLEGRGRRIYIKDRDILMIDESYNANPASMLSALSILAAIRQGRRVAVLGQMAEIGPISKDAHREVAEAAKKSADYTIGVGEEFKNSRLDIWYGNVSELNQHILEIIRPGDIILVKGSRSNELDKLINFLQNI